MFTLPSLSIPRIKKSNQLATHYIGHLLVGIVPHIWDEKDFPVDAEVHVFGRVRVFKFLQTVRHRPQSLGAVEGHQRTKKQQ